MKAPRQEKHGVGTYNWLPVMIRIGLLVTLTTVILGTAIALVPLPQHKIVQEPQPVHHASQIAMVSTLEQTKYTPFAQVDTLQTQVVTDVPSVTPTNHDDIMQQAGINAGDYQYVEYIVSHESGWRATAVNSEGSGATGLCQALPASKMASAGSDYLTNPVTQLRWCNSYSQKYGGWKESYEFWLSHRWW